MKGNTPMWEHICTAASGIAQRFGVEDFQGKHRKGHSGKGSY